MKYNGSSSTHLPVTPTISTLLEVNGIIRKCHTDHRSKLLEKLHAQRETPLNTNCEPATTSPYRDSDWWDDATKDSRPVQPQIDRSLLTCHSADILLRLILPDGSQPPEGTIWSDVATSHWGIEYPSQSNNAKKKKSTDMLLPPRWETKKSCSNSKKVQREDIDFLHPLPNIINAISKRHSIIITGSGSKLDLMEIIRSHWVELAVVRWRKSGGDRSTISEAELHEPKLVIGEMLNGSFFNTPGSVLDYVLFLLIRSHNNRGGNCTCGGRGATRSQTSALEGLSSDERHRREFAQYNCSYCKSVISSVARWQEKQKIAELIALTSPEASDGSAPVVLVFIHQWERMEKGEFDYLKTFGGAVRRFFQFVVSSRGPNSLDSPASYYLSSEDPCQAILSPPVLVTLPPILSFTVHCERVLEAAAKVGDEEEADLVKFKRGWFLSAPKSSRSHRSHSSSEVSSVQETVHYEYEDDDEQQTNNSDPLHTITQEMYTSVLTNLNDDRYELILGVMEQLQTSASKVECRCAQKCIDDDCPEPYLRQRDIVERLKDHGIAATEFANLVRPLINEGLIGIDQKSYYRLVSVQEEVELG
eukprot:GHVH01005298.1.p1 GENE.GHVH01005298.1~~GHVH01005298.1.p1  ORF type:complete len:589 (-),score=87.11 GHVH01005298.1:226-1992(-)